MKKSKIIVPALALIAFSTAASITGTVAWFTASRSAVVTAGTYSIQSTATGLSYSVGNGVATTGSGANGSVSLNSNTELTDGSFDHVNKLFFAPTADGTALADPNGISLSDAQLATKLVRATKSTITYYTAATFTLTVSYEFGETGDTMALYLDATKSHFYKAGTTTAPSKMGKALRVAIVGQTDDVTTTKVVGLADSNANSKYINYDHASTGAAGSFAAHGDSYASGLIDSGFAASENATLPAASGDSRITVSAAEARTDYLGKFVFSESVKNQTVNLSFTCVVWYEGTHTEIKNSSTETDFEDMDVTLAIEAISCKAGA